MEPKIQQFLLKLPENKRQAALLVREIILGVNPGITEAIKWNNLTFIYGKANLAFIFTFPSVNYINLGFFNAVRLSDTKKLFEGTGKAMRHIKIRTEDEIPVTALRKWVKESIAMI